MDYRCIGNAVLRSMLTPAGRIAKKHEGNLCLGIICINSISRLETNIRLKYYSVRTAQ